jgi:ribosomal protein RSM22 (predicted rRNA methylase)
LVIVGPGTPKDFERLVGLRRSLISAGAHLVAPCPHHDECPMWAANDWCHFAQRIERTAVHRRLKQGSLGYEDEKFSFLVAAKQPIGRASARIVRHPQKNPGHVQLQLCTPTGLQRETIGKSQRERYRAARKSEWGDSWE